MAASSLVDFYKNSPNLKVSQLEFGGEINRVYSGGYQRVIGRVPSARVYFWRVSAGFRLGFRAWSLLSCFRVLFSSSCFAALSLLVFLLAALFSSVVYIDLLRVFLLFLRRAVCVLFCCCSLLLCTLLLLFSQSSVGAVEGWSAGIEGWSAGVESLRRWSDEWSRRRAAHAGSVGLLEAQWKRA